MKKKEQEEENLMVPAHQKNKNKKQKNSCFMSGSTPILTPNTKNYQYYLSLHLIIILSVLVIIFLITFLYFFLIQILKFTNTFAALQFIVQGVPQFNSINEPTGMFSRTILQ